MTPPPIPGDPAPPALSLPRRVMWTLVIVPILGVALVFTLYGALLAMLGGALYLTGLAVTLVVLAARGASVAGREALLARVLIWGTLPAWIGASTATLGIFPGGLSVVIGIGGIAVVVGTVLGLDHRRSERWLFLIPAGAVVGTLATAAILGAASDAWWLIVLTVLGIVAGAGALVLGRRLPRAPRAR